MNRPGRYLRQTLLAEIGASGQRRLDQARVMSIGAGGLGCASLPYLAGAGIGSIVIIDSDRVARDNLHRQVLFGETDIGQAKATAAARRLRNLNPDIDIIAHDQRVHAGNIEALLDQCDLIIDGSDNYPTKYLAGDASVKFGVPLVYGSATGMEALVTVFAPEKGPCLRCLFPEAPRGWVPNCAEAGVLGPLVGMAGALQAVEAIKLLAGDDRLSPLIGRLWMADARDMSIRQLAIERRADCPVCSMERDRIELASESAMINEISADALSAAGAVTVIDVREPDEYGRGHIPGAINLPLSSLQDGSRDLPKVSRCVVYCQTGPRALVAASVLLQAGVGEVQSLRGGLSEWNGEKVKAER